MPDLAISSPRGSISIARDVVAEIVAETASRCYGVVGFEPGSRLGKILRRDGVTVGGGAQAIQVGLHVVVESGLNLAEVAAAVRSQVAYEVERLTGLHVGSVEVVVQNVRESA